jgi:hypothetical protein
MYDPLTTGSGIDDVIKYLSNFQIESGPDGLSLATGDGGNYGMDLEMSERLRDWLVGIRLLRDLPFSYLVPDARMLPPESIRFFHLDATWIDRVVDGIFAAANFGTVDFVFSYSVLQMARAAIDDELTTIAATQVPMTSWTGDQRITGMLMRSELARRWPDLIVRAYTSANADPKLPDIAVLRAEPISKDLYIALFAGQPAMVHVREPDVGTRFGVEPRLNPTPAQPYQVDDRGTNGIVPDDSSPIVLSFRGPANLRILNFAALATDPKSDEDTPRQVALNLEQPPYVQQFIGPHQESDGSTDPGSLGATVQFRRGRFMSLDKLKARKAELEELES